MPGSDTVGETWCHARRLFGPVCWDDGAMTDAGGFALPVGTVTLVLADVEGSTRTWEQNPDDMGRAIARMNETVDEVVARHDGVRPVEQGEGDSFVAAFSRASDAISCALDLQRRVEDDEAAPLRLRVGVHTGEVQLRGGGNYVGPAFNRAARLRDAAHGGQIIVSQAAYELVRDRLPGSVTAKDLGSHRLRDLGRPEHVFQLVHPDLPVRFPPLRTLDHVPNNLPVYLTSFVGREPELAVLRKLLAEIRMLTLTGAGGCGKTRLALELAARRLEDHPDGVWFVDLAKIVHAKAVPAAVAAAIGVREQQGRRLTDVLVDHLADHAVLLVIDNCEHVVGGAAELVEQLLVACPALTVVATSREALGVPGETASRVPSLSVPHDHQPARLDALGQFEAVELFIERARNARPNFVVTNETAPAVAAVCQRLDGIPLAIELAAARARVLSPQQILDGLGDRFRLLTGGARTAVARQQTLRASVDWSYELLTEAERQALAHASVFAGGFTLEAAEAVIGAPPIDRLAVLDLLQSLVDKSLLLVEDVRGSARYRMLETIRQYASERLAASQEDPSVRNRHLDFYVALAERAEPRFEGAEQEEWAELLEVDRHNVRAAFDWAHTGGNADGALRIVAALFWFWIIRGRLGEGWRLCRRALQLREAASEQVRARALAAICHVGWFRIDLTVAPLSTEAVEVARRCGDRRSEGRALYHAAWWGMGTDRDRASADLQESIAIARELDDRWSLAMSLTQAGTLLANDGRAVEATPIIEEAAAVCAALGERYIANTVRYYLARARVFLGHTAEGQTLLRETIAFAGTTGDTFSLTMAQADLALVLALAGELEESIRVGTDNAALFDDGHLPWPGHALQAHGVLSTVLTFAGRHAEARHASETALALCRELPTTEQFHAGTLATLATNEHDIGEPDAARTHYQEALAVLDDAVSWPAAAARDTLARLAHAFGDDETAERLAQEALAIAAQTGNHHSLGGAAPVLDTLTVVVDDPRLAGRLLGAVDARTAAAGQARPPSRQPAYDATLARLREALGNDELQGLLQEGSRLSTDEAVAYARRGRSRRRRRSTGWDSLTPAERNVVKLVAQGLSNPQIAQRLFVSRKTVTAHLTHVFAKLGVSSRAELSAQAARRGM
jgi:predicted ATPase/class 3 adenylate cyclase/DNA-binding CsgD family transcriptional regulator